MSDLFANLVGRAQGNMPQLRPLHRLYRGDMAPQPVALEENVDTPAPAEASLQRRVESNRQETRIPAPGAIQTPNQEPVSVPPELPLPAGNLPAPTLIAPTMQRKEMPGAIPEAALTPVPAAAASFEAHSSPAPSKDWTPASVSHDATLSTQYPDAKDATTLVHVAHNPSEVGSNAIVAEPERSTKESLVGWDESVRDANAQAAAPASIVPFPGARPHTANVNLASLSSKLHQTGEPSAAVVEQDERVVTISIGRLEVKVTPTAKAAKSAAGATPTSGLADYLRTRQGGGQ